MEVDVGIKRTAVLVILKYQNQFLLLKRLKAPNKDKYTPVGGKLEPHENPIKAAYRETLEETGIRPEKLHYKGLLIESAPTKYNWTCLVYLAEIPWQEPPYCNEGTLEWIPYEKILDVPTPPTDWYIYKYVLENKPFFLNAEFDADLNMIELTEEIADETLVSKMKSGQH